MIYHLELLWYTDCGWNKINPPFFLEKKCWVVVIPCNFVWMNDVCVNIDSCFCHWRRKPMKANSSSAIHTNTIDIGPVLRQCKLYPPPLCQPWVMTSLGKKMLVTLSQRKTGLCGKKSQSGAGAVWPKLTPYFSLFDFQMDFPSLWRGWKMHFHALFHCETSQHFAFFNQPCITVSFGICRL